MTVAITFRTSGAWGSGAGTPLSAAQVDTNFYNLKQAVETLQTSIPAASVGIDTFSVSGTDFYVTLTDGTTEGPYPLPVVEWNFRDAWAPSTVYAVNDVINANNALYIVTYAHTSATTFDAGANDGLGHQYYELLVNFGSSYIPTGGITGQVLAKATSADFDIHWVNQSGGGGGGGSLAVVPTYSSTDVIVGGDLSSNPTTLSTPWDIGDCTWTSGQLSFTYTGSNNPLIQIPVSGLVVGKWYIVEFVGTVTNDFNYSSMLDNSGWGSWGNFGTGSFMFKARYTSGTIGLDMWYYNTGAAKTLTSVSCRQIDDPVPVEISSPSDVVASFGVDQNVTLGEGAAANPDAPANNAPLGVAIGFGAMYGSGTGGGDHYNNVAIGILALNKVDTGNSNVGIGTSALPQLTTGQCNNAVGASAGFNLTTGSFNNFFGTLAGYLGTTTGSANIAIGHTALKNLTNGSYNTAIGHQVAPNLNGGSYNVVIGADAAPSLSSGTYSVIIGQSAGGSLSSGGYSVVIGYNAGITNGSLLNCIVIGYNASVSETNAISIGNSSIVKFYVGTKKMGVNKHKLVSGAAAGSITVSGIYTDDRLDEVIYYPSSYDVIDLTSEFTINSTNSINNTGGTNTTGGKLMVRWASMR